MELSKLMRHILYDGDTNISPLSDEVQFLQNYIALMKMRFTGMVKVNTDFPAMTSVLMVDIIFQFYMFLMLLHMGFLFFW